MNADKHQKPLDLSSIQQRLVERKRALSVQRRQCTERWKCAKEAIDDEFHQRQKELEGARVSAHKDLDEIHQSCDLVVEVLTKQLQRDIELVTSLRSLKAVERDVSKILELAKRASKPQTLCVLPTVAFKEGEMELRLSNLHVKGLSELISEMPHRCFSSGVVGLVASYINTTVEFKGKCCLEYTGHECQVWCAVGLSGRVATGYGDGLIHVWNSQSGKQLLGFNGHSDIVTSLVVVDDNRLLSSSWDKTVRLWDLRTGRCIRVYKGHTDYVACVCTFADSKGVLRAASGGYDNMICIWDLDTGECIRVLRGHTDWLLHVSATTDGSQRLVSGSVDGTVRVWNSEATQCLRVLKGHTDWVVSVVVLSDQKQVVSASWDSTLRVWNIETGECLRVLQEHNMVRSVCMSVDGQYIVSINVDSIMRVWNVNTGECLKVVELDSGVSRLCCLEDGRIAVVGDNKVQIWE